MRWTVAVDQALYRHGTPVAEHDDSDTGGVRSGAAFSLVCNCMIYCDLPGANRRLRRCLLNRDQTAQTQNAII